MCGIAGIVSRGDLGVIGPMIESLAHRGPDGQGRYCDDFAALGHRRLSVIDLEGGAQPLANEDGSLQLIANGEIYNSPALRRRLQASGHDFRTHTDTEVVLHLYEEHGIDCVHHLRGMFALAIWDIPRRRLFLARDHLGQKPLFFARVGEDLLFASEIKALLASGRIDPRPDLDALWHYVSLRFIPDRYSLFDGIEKLPAASRLVFENGEVEIDRYWNPDFRDKLSGSEEETADRLEDLLLDTVQMHMLSDVRVGAFLSGGIDSSLVAAMMAKTSGATIPTFSIGVKEQQFDELPFARAVAERYGMEAHERVVQADLIRLMPAMIWHLDEPSDPYGAGVYLVAELASGLVKVVLTGDGGDENFAGYDRFVGQRLVDLYCLLPEVVRRGVMSRLVRLVPESFAYKSLAKKLAWLNEMSFDDGGERYAHSMSFLRFPAAAKQQLFTSAARERVGDVNSVEKVLRYFDSERVEDLVDRMLYTDLMTRMPDHLLPIVDRMSMAHSLETRAPLIDHKVVEFAASMPADMKLRGRNLKHLFKRVASKYLPRELIRREKQGFGFPLGLWMRAELRHFIRNLLAESRFVEHGLFERLYLDRLTREHIEGRADHSFRLWILINLELWYRLYFEGETVDSLSETTKRLMAPSWSAGRGADEKPV